MYPPAHPCSQIGQLEAEIRNIQQKLSGKAENYEINTLLNRICNLEYSIREIGSSINGILSQLQELKESKLSTKTD